MEQIHFDNDNGVKVVHFTCYKCGRDISTTYHFNERVLCYECKERLMKKINPLISALKNIEKEYDITVEKFFI